MARPSGPVAAFCLALLLAGCTGLPFSRGDTPGLAPSASPSAPRRPGLSATDAASGNLVQRYAREQSLLRAQGRLRRDDGRSEGPFGASRLVAVWSEVALREEHGGSAGLNAPLRRWNTPVQIGLEFGASVPANIRARDRNAVAGVATQIAASSRHSVQLAPDGAPGVNFHVLVLSEAERQAIGPRLETLLPGIDPAAVRLVTGLPSSARCLALAFARNGGATYTDVIAVVRAELPDLMRLSCYHEEIAQGMGLAADSDDAFPSLFNDDQEFATLTALDLMLLRLHYDPRLRTGSYEREARPQAEIIATELAGGES